MQAVPVLVGTSAAIGAASSGLVFGQSFNVDEPDLTRPFSSNPTDSDFLGPPLSHVADTSHLNQTLAPAEVQCRTSSNQLTALPSSSPSESASNSLRLRPLSAHFSLAKSSARRHSFIRYGESSVPASASDGPDRESVSSSSGSWMRRFSLRPLSHHGSLRSSVGPDSTSLTFSLGSGPLIPSPVSLASDPSLLPPNKLVKRIPSECPDTCTDNVPRWRSRTRLPIIRRPATSHQRSAVVRQTRRTLPCDAAANTNSPEAPNAAADLSRWYSYIHLKVVEVTSRSGRSGRSPEFNPNRRPGLGGSNHLYNMGEKPRAHLTTASLLAAQPDPSPSQATTEYSIPYEVAEDAEQLDSSRHEATPPGQTRRSLSKKISSRISRAGSLRRPKRSADAHRYVSAPEVADSLAPEAYPMESSQASARPAVETDYSPDGFQRDLAPPLPILARLSSFNLDLSRVGSGGAAACAIPVTRQNQPSGSSHVSSALGRPTTSSDADARGFISCDDDDTDFKSETVFDSIRTGTSGKARNVDTPLESMFDESPPSTAGNNVKARRLSIQEILGRSWDDDARIAEEEEGMATPVRRRQGIGTTGHAPPGNVLGSNHSHRARVSLDDDFDDDDWAKDDNEEHLSSPLSPPSKGGSTGRRAISPNVRLALACISGDVPSELGDSGGNRPLSNLFDWSEPSPVEKNADGYTPRPRTVHGKQDADRGGRPAIRKGPLTAHVRSQSVPVVHEANESSRVKSIKFGTWGMASKTVSEDWEDDFEFGSAENGVGAKSEAKAIAVPASIQASQPSVKAHCGQIREFSLLVDDLKRLLRRGNDLDLLQGPGAGLWKEAEGIIALASPDDDAVEDSNESSSPGPDSSNVSERFLDVGFDAASLEDFETSKVTPEVPMSKTEVVRERSSPRRRSVFSPDDDIFGANWPLTENLAQPQPERPKTPEDTPSRRGQDKAAAVQSVMEAVHHRASRDRVQPPNEPEGKVHFGTNSLKALVKRAGDLRDSLAESVRRADPVAGSPVRTPRRCTNDSPAFTQMFTEPSSSTPRHLVQSHSSILGRGSKDVSPSSSIGQCMQMMTVS